MKNFTLTLHIISMCLVVGTLFLQSLIVVFRLRLKKQEEIAGVKNVQKRIHKFIYYPILGVTIVSGAILSNIIDIFSQAQSNWIKSIPAMYVTHQNEKKTEYGPRAREIEKATLTAAVMSTSGGMGKEMDQLVRRIATLFKSVKGALRSDFTPLFYLLILIYRMKK